MPRSRSRMGEDGGQNKEPKKRTRNPSEWKREKRKRLRVAGKSYINSKGDLVHERKIGEDCRCRRKCYQIVSEEQRHKLFDGYYSLQSHDEQNAYLFGLIRKHDIARKRHKDSDRRTCSYKYFVRIRGKEVQICRLAFAHIHGISPHKIRILCQKQDQNIMFPRDGRGRHENRPRKISEETLAQVKNHIYSIIRSDRVRDFLKEEKHNGPDLNITKMWKDYLEKYDPNFYSLQFGNEKVGHHQQQQPQQQQQQHHQHLQQAQPQQLAEPMAPDRLAMPGFSGGHGHHHHHPPPPPQHHHPGTYNNLAQYQQMTVMASNLGLLGHVPQYETSVCIIPYKAELPVQLSSTAYETQVEVNVADHHGQPHYVQREPEVQQQPPPPPPPPMVVPQQGQGQPKMKGPKPIVKHWLYSKTFHDEFKFQDFLSLKKKLWLLKEDKASQNAAIKTERKQKSPKKISREKELAQQLQHAVNSNTAQSAAPHHHQLAATQSDMYILPVGLQELTQIPPQASDMLQQQHHAMQLNLHTFSTQANVLSPIINAQGGAPQSSSVVTLPAATMSLAQNSCNYVNMNATTFYQ